MPTQSTYSEYVPGGFSVCHVLSKVRYRFFYVRKYLPLISKSFLFVFFILTLFSLSSLSLLSLSFLISLSLSVFFPICFHHVGLLVFLWCVCFSSWINLSPFHTDRNTTSNSQMANMTVRIIWSIVTGLRRFGSSQGLAQVFWFWISLLAMVKCNRLINVLWRPPGSQFMTSWLLTSQYWSRHGAYSLEENDGWCQVTSRSFGAGDFPKVLVLNCLVFGLLAMMKKWKEI